MCCHPSHSRSNGNVIGLPLSLPRHISKKRYWRLVSDRMKLRNFQSIEKPCNDDAHGYVVSSCSAMEHADYIHTAWGQRCSFRLTGQCEGLIRWSEQQSASRFFRLIIARPEAIGLCNQWKVKCCLISKNGFFLREVWPPRRAPILMSAVWKGHSGYGTINPLLWRRSNPI